MVTMNLRTIRTAALVGLLVLVAACGKATMSSEQATQVAVDAFATAGLEPEVGEVTEAATVDRAIDGEFIEVHQVEMIIADKSYLAGVNRKEGAVVRLIEPADTELTDEQVEAIAAFRDNPAEDDARRGRTITWIVILLLMLVGVYAFFRNERRKAEAAGDGSAELLPLD